jgi:glycosyltransferase involved in cell wall biosynthesis
MKVMQIITKGEAGGAQTHLLEICRALQGPVEMTVMIGGGDAAGTLESQLQALGIRSLRLPLMVNSLSPRRLLRAARALARVLQQERPDLVHAHSAIAGVAARLAGAWTRIPVVYTVHGFGFKPQVPLLQRMAARVVEWLLAPWTGHMICVSQHERELARRLPLPARRISVVRNAVQDHPLRADPAAGPMRVIMVARCAPPKRHDLLLQALGRAAARLGREIPATLVGGGPQLAALQAQAQSLGLQQVRFTGDVDNVAGLLAGHGVFALLSDHEGLPIAVIEAMRSGLPVLASDLPGLRELVTPDEEGWLLPNRVEPLADALVALERQPAERARLGQAARRRYERECTPADMAQAVLAVYGQIADHD